MRFRLLTLYPGAVRTYFNSIGFNSRWSTALLKNNSPVFGSALRLQLLAHGIQHSIDKVHRLRR